MKKIFLAVDAFGSSSGVRPVGVGKTASGYLLALFREQRMKKFAKNLGIRDSWSRYDENIIQRNVLDLSLKFIIPTKLSPGNDMGPNTDQGFTKRDSSKKLNNTLKRIKNWSQNDTELKQIKILDCGGVPSKVPVKNPWVLSYKLIWS